jgi:starch phosphorylase
MFAPLIDGLFGRDEYMVMSDFTGYSACQREVARVFLDEDGWSRRAAYNVARVGTFSSDRTIRQYASEIWQVKPLEIVLDPYVSSGNPK